MVRNSKFFRDITIFILIILVSCSSTDLKDTPIPTVSKNRLLVIIDQSESVNYLTKSTTLDDALQANFQATYKHVYNPTEFYTADITTESNVVALAYPFRNEFPKEKNMGKVSYKLKYGEWRSAKKKWMTDGISKIKSSVLSPKKGYTDVYSIFRCIDLKGKDLRPQDTLNVLFISDMKHSEKNYELTRILSGKDPIAMAKKEFQRLGISKKGTNFHCKITIVTPENFSQSNVITSYWDTFFKHWGISTVIDWR